MQTSNGIRVRTTQLCHAVWALLLAGVLAATGPANAQTDKTTVATTANVADNSLPCVVDLTPYYVKKYKGRTKSGLFTGHQVVDGLPFELGGECILHGKDNADRNSVAHSVSKMEVTGIKIGRKFDELHLMHSVQWREYNGCPVAILRLHYADGTSHDFEMRYNYQVLDCTRLLSEEREIIADPDTKIIWRGVNGAAPWKGTHRLFKSMLRNPFPDREVVSMDIISTRSRASYVLEAATVSRSDPHREVTAGLPLNQPVYPFDGTLKVLVVDKETGAPIVGAEVNPSMSIDNAGVVADPILTSTNGVAQVKYPVSQTSHLGVQVSKAGYLGRYGNWQSGAIPDSITYRLGAARASIQGLVQDADGKPVAGVQIQLNNFSFGNLDEQIHLANDSTVTDAAGHWRIQGLPENYQDFGITVSHPDFPQAQFLADGAHKRGMQGAHIRSADFYGGQAVLTMTRGSKLSGSVRDEAGKPVVNAALFVGFDRYMSGAVKSETDEQGNFTLKNLGLGENYLTVSAKGFAPQFLTVSVAASNAPLAVVLKPGQMVRGRVVDAAGQPLAGADVSYDGLVANRNRMSGGRTIEWKTKTGANGEFTWDSAPAEAVRLSIRKGGYMALEWQMVQPGTTDTVTFTLGSPLTVKGSVTDADSGAPLARFTVTPGWPESDGARLEKFRASAGKNGHYEILFDSPIVISTKPYDYVFQISAPGYAPAQSRAIKPGEGVVTWDVKLKKTPATIATVKTADGKPAAGVKVYLAGARDYLQLDGTDLSNQNRAADSFETDADGHFELPPQTGNFNLAAASPAGFALVSKADFTNRLTLTLQPWGRVEGTLLRNGRPLPDRELYFFLGDGAEQRNVWMRTPVAVDAAGHFIFPNVPAGINRIELKQPMADRSWSYKELQSLEVKPGGTNIVQATLEGRDVTGRWKKEAGLPAEVNLEQGNISLSPAMAPPPVPEGLDSPEKIQEWYKSWMKTEAGKKFIAAQRKRGQLQMKADGTLRGESIAPGKYTLSGSFWGQAGAVAEMASREVVIPESATSAADAPFDLGEVLIKAVKHLNIGDLAPEFSVKTLDDQPLKLSAFRGKYVLLDFWATWCGPCVAETPHLKAAYDAYGSDPRFVMISLSLDQSIGLPKKFAQTHDIKWLQGFLGDWSKDTVAKDYCVRGIPSLFLIGPDGKIIAQNLRGEEIKTAVGAALGAK